MPKKQKEDRSGWVAVEPEFKAPATEIRKATSAYQFFQRDAAEDVKAELLSLKGKVEIADYGRAIRDRWNNLSEDEKARYEELAKKDKFRYGQESHAADVAAMQRREKLQQERACLLLDDEGGTQRTTRRGMEKKKRKRERETRKKKVGDDKDGGSDSEASWNSSDDSSDSSYEGNKKKVAPHPRKVSQKQIEHRAKMKKEKQEKETYIANRQEDLRKERSSQAKRRLEFLLKQSDIFSHFGNVKEDTAKFGIKAADRKEGESARRVASTEEDDAAALEEADEHEATFLTSQPLTLGFGKMRPYQLEGLNWMIRLQENGVNGILADEMGLGKTLQAISILVYMMEYKAITGPHLIVVPKSTLSNWMNEISRWAPTLKAIRFQGDKASREEMIKNDLEPAQRDENRRWNICVTTYEVCNIEKSTLNKFTWNYLIIDEAHRLKNEASAFSQTVRNFEVRYRLLLTGTPLQNSLHELWALLNFLVPDVFESAEQFDEWFNLDIDDTDEKNKLISQLHKILRPFMLRRLKVDVEKSLPPKHETILFTGMSAMQKKLYRDILTRDIEAIQGTSGNRTAILNIVMQLRKCAGHPYLFPGVEDRTLPPLGEHLVENCGKLVVLDKLLKRLRERGHRVLLFTQMTRILDIMEDYLVMRRFPYCRIDGNTCYEDREERIDKFNAPNSEKFLFLLSTRAGGLGINLQTADIVILYDSDWNPQADLQAADRAHRIGQKKPVQVFRLVTEHTIEEKIVERAQQKLKLDAMVVQQGRLKDKDKLSRDELLAAVRFGADKIFKSKDSSITDDDIDLILDLGKRKTQELNDKLKTAEKGDLLDFKLGGGSMQTFEGVDYSDSVLAQAKAEAEMMGIFDIGKRERKEANYNENSLYQQQVASLQSSIKKPKRKKQIRLPKHLRLPRMEEWQMYDRQALLAIQEEEEKAFKSLPEEQQKMATATTKDEEPMEGHVEGQEPVAPFELKPLLSEEKQALKNKLLDEGFSGWKRHEYTLFVKASARHGRNSFENIALEVGKLEEVVRRYASAFWGNLGKSRISEHEYGRVAKLVEKGEKKISEIRALERGARVLVSHFDNPWEELEFTYVNCKDKMFTAEEDRHLLCWTRKYGYGQWEAVRMAIRRNPRFRFNYFLRSLPVDILGRRCEQLVRAAIKEVEQLEKTARAKAGLPLEPDKEGEELPSIQLPKFAVMQRERREAEQTKAALERKKLEEKVEEIENQIKTKQERLKALNETGSVQTNGVTNSEDVKPEKKNHPRSNSVKDKITSKIDKPDKAEIGQRDDGAIGPDGSFIAFPEYDGSEPPNEFKKPFTQFCNRTRREVKASLDPSERRDKKKVNGLLKERWLQMAEEEKDVWRKWTEWDKKRHEHDVAIFENRRNSGSPVAIKDEKKQKADAVHVPKKRRVSDEGSTISKKHRS